ncbi:MAG: hypothetical protein KBA28_13235 [Syntrophaceae bacterium]|nr:hypothetical protein [Syntrophaceae bacterium]
MSKTTPLLRKMFLIAITIFFASVTASGQEFRTINAVPTPGKTPSGASLLEEVRPIAKNQATESIGKVMSSWNSGEIQQFLGNDFYDKNGLTDAIGSKVPRDAAIRILSVQGVQTLQQFQKKKDGGGNEIISEVSVTADTQIEYNDPTKGFVKFSGLNEYIIRITEETVR